MPRLVNIPKSARQLDTPIFEACQETLFANLAGGTMVGVRPKCSAAATETNKTFRPNFLFLEGNCRAEVSSSAPCPSSGVKTPDHRSANRVCPRIVSTEKSLRFVCFSSMCGLTYPRASFAPTQVVTPTALARVIIPATEAPAAVAMASATHRSGGNGGAGSNNSWTVLSCISDRHISV